MGKGKKKQKKKERKKETGGGGTNAIRKKKLETFSLLFGFAIWWKWLYWDSDTRTAASLIFMAKTLWIFLT